VLEVRGGADKGLDGHRLDTVPLCNQLIQVLTRPQPNPHLTRPRLPYDAKVANRNVKDFGWEMRAIHGAVSRRPPISLYTIVARTEGYTYAAKVWDFSLVQGAIFCRRPNPYVRFATFASLNYSAVGRRGPRTTPTWSEPS
jgi:hypothetical protein